jgi:hypothetical protein
MQESAGEALHRKIKHGIDGPRDLALIAASKPLN